MKDACQEFRSRLAGLLAGRVETVVIGELAWHEHLLACADCRDLLAAEEALEQLLASLPSPKLPRALAERVLSRLEPMRTSDAALDALLDLPLAAPAPDELAQRVLSNLAKLRELERAEQRLDRLLERVPPPNVPARLSAQILAGVESQRERVVPRKLQPMQRVPVAKRNVNSSSHRRDQLAPHPTSRRWIYTLAASLAIASGVTAWLLSTSQQDATSISPEHDVATNTSPPERSPVDGPPTETNDPPQELLASLDLLESWDLVTDDSLDARLNTLDNFDELLLSIDADSAATETHDSDATPSSEPPHKG